MRILTKPTFTEELKFWNLKINHVIGLDEVGRGAFAGPIVGAGVIYKPNFKHDFLEKVHDSKLIRPKLREELSKLIKENSIWSIESIDIKYINKHGIGKANIAVFRKVLKSILKNFNDLNHFTLIDGFSIPGESKQKAIIGGDGISLSIASASIIAKVHRDNLMRKAGEIYPNYLFAKNKGYGTLEHRNALKIHGLSNLHRVDFCKNIN